MKPNWIDHILRRHCLLKHIVEGKIEGNIEAKGKRERVLKLLSDNLKEMAGYRKFNKEALDRTLWRNCLGRSHGPLVIQHNL